MNIADHLFKMPTELSDQAYGKIEDIKSAPFKVRADLFRDFFDKYSSELNRRRNDLSENVSNFQFLSNYYCDTKKTKEIASALEQFTKFPGFYVWRENGNIHFKCKFEEAVNEFSRNPGKRELNIVR